MVQHLLHIQNLVTPEMCYNAGVFGGWFLRSAQVGRASESFNLHQSKMPKGRSPLLPFSRLSG